MANRTTGGGRGSERDDMGRNPGDVGDVGRGDLGGGAGRSEDLDRDRGMDRDLDEGIDVPDDRGRMRGGRGSRNR